MLTPFYREHSSATQIYKLVYRSQVAENSDAARRESDIADILRASQAWNSAHGITGALLLSPTGYAQVLEGPPHAVKSLFGHIACDLRHQKVELLYHEHHWERDFGNWSMVVVGPPDQDDVELASTAHHRNITLSGGADDILAMLHWLLVDEPDLQEGQVTT